MKAFYLIIGGLILMSGCSLWHSTELLEIPVTTGQIVSRQSFTSVDIAGPFTIKYHKGTEHLIRITGDEMLVKQVELAYLGDMAHIALPNEHNKSLFIEITAPSIDAIYLAGAITANFTDLDRDTITIRAAGAYTGTFSGKAHSVRVTASGAGSIDTTALEAQVVDIEASGASNVSVWAEKELAIKAYGATTVRYKGTPHIIEQTAGAASIKAL